MTYYRVLLIIFIINQVFLGFALCHFQRTNFKTFTAPLKNETHQIQNTTNEIPSEDSTIKANVELKLYYETYCPASVDFFVNQLKPAVKRLGSHLDVHLIPYGHAKTYRSSDGGYTFSCQHGPRECYGNMVHACVIDVLQNNTRAISFNGCLMQYTSYHGDYNYFVSILRWCSYAEKVHIFDVWKCVHSERGPTLLRGYGDETFKLKPRYVPFLEVDGSTEHQDKATGNLVGTVCSLLYPKPQTCFTSE